MSEVGSMEAGKADDNLRGGLGSTGATADNAPRDRDYIEEGLKPRHPSPLPDKWDALRKAAEAIDEAGHKWSHSELLDRSTGTEAAVWGSDGDAVCMVHDNLGLDINAIDRAKFIAIANPAVILELLSELRGMEDSRKNLHRLIGALISSHKDELERLRGMERGGEGLQDYWRCFHCDFATYNHAEAEAHFGDRDDAEEFKPLCKWWQLMDEDERIETLQAIIMQLNEANAAEVAVCPKCNHPHYNMEDSAACRATLSVTEGVDGREK